MSQVVITGGSRGIGAAAVRRFSALGHRVFFFYRNHTQEAQRICQETGAIAFQVDVRIRQRYRMPFPRSALSTF